MKDKNTLNHLGKETDSAWGITLGEECARSKQQSEEEEHNAINHNGIWQERSTARLPRQSGNRKGLIGYLPLDAVRFTDETVSGTFLHGVKTVRHVFAQCENMKPNTTRHNPTPTNDEFRRPLWGRSDGVARATP